MGRTLIPQGDLAPPLVQFPQRMPLQDIKQIPPVGMKLLHFGAHRDVRSDHAFHFQERWKLRPRLH